MLLLILETRLFLIDYLRETQMPFVKNILAFKTVSIVGLEKNTGKTECLNYIINRLKSTKKKIALTSIGVDGEQRDIVSNKPKPEIKIEAGSIFISAEKHYLQRRITSEILEVSDEHTSLGRLVTAKAITADKVLLSGPADTHTLKKTIAQMDKFGVDLTLVDGALSRLSLASPAITDGMILTTGASLSANLPELVKRTKFVVDLINLPKVELSLKNKLDDFTEGIYIVDDKLELHNLQVQSVFMLEKLKENIFDYGNRLYVTGAVTNQLLEFLRMQKNIKHIELIIRDFTKVFATPEVYASFVNKGGKIKVLQKTKLIAVCINPTSPQGYHLDSDKLKNALQDALKMAVYDIKKLN